MPTYEFICKSCRHHFEVFTSISKKGEIICPECQNRQLQESYGAVHIGGNLSNPGAGSGSCTNGNCSTCGSHCNH